MYFFFLYSENKLKIYHRSYSSYTQNASADPCIMQDTCHIYILHIWLLSPTLMTKRIALFVRLESHPSSSYWSVALVSVLDFQTYYFKV